MNIPDARRAGPGIGWRERRTSPGTRPSGSASAANAQGPNHRMGHRAGRSELGAPSWDCVILADEPAGCVPWQGCYVYDPAAIRRRDGDTPPGELPLPRLSGTHHHPRLAVSGHTRLSRMYCPRRHSVSSRQTSSSDQQIRHFGQGLASVAIAAPATAPRVPVIRVSHGQRLAEARHTRPPRPATASGQATGPKSQLQAGRPASAS